MNENNFNKPYDTSTTGTTCINETNYCQYRLPCGYCKILEKHCLMNYNITYTYQDKVYAPPYNLNQVTCKMEES